MSPPGCLHPVQVAYHVPDPEAAALRFARDYGWGPFYLMRHIPLTWARHRDQPAEFDHSSAYGQAGEVMVELITQHGNAPSALRDLYGPEQTGIHHVACFVPQLPTALEEARNRGEAVALEAMTQNGVHFAMVDTSTQLGHMLELYEQTPALADFYAFIRRKAAGWDGSRPLRELS